MDDRGRFKSVLKLFYKQISAFLEKSATEILKINGNLSRAIETMKVIEFQQVNGFKFHFTLSFYFVIIKKKLERLRSFPKREKIESFCN